MCQGGCACDLGMCVTICFHVNKSKSVQNRFIFCVSKVDLLWFVLVFVVS